MSNKRKVDLNHKLIRETLRGLGFKVEDTSRFGRGFPDLLVFGLNHRTEDHRLMMVEVKSKRGKLRVKQKEFADEWNGAVIVAYSVSDVLMAYHWTEAEIEQLAENRQPAAA